MSYQNAPVLKPKTPDTSSIRSESSTKLEFRVYDADEELGSDALYWEQARSVTWLEFILALLLPLPFGLVRGDNGLWNTSVFRAFWRLLSNQMAKPDQFRPALTLWSTSVGAVFILAYLVSNIGSFFLVFGAYFLVSSTLLMCIDCLGNRRRDPRRERFLYEGI
uniref:Uncharacterized protein n=1 Tax=Plectus sambesii TaxID=2011161 RepID=A0A914UM05_9BILA